MTEEDPYKEDDEEQFDFGIIKKFWDRLDVRDLLLIVMILLMFLMYIISQSDVASCNLYWSGIVENMTITKFPLMYK